MEKTKNKTINKKNTQVSKKNKAFLYATIGFVVAILLISSIIGFVVVPLLNKSLVKFGIKSVNEFIGFYQDLNQYVPEKDMVKNGFSSNNYSLAYSKLTSNGLNVFKDDDGVSDFDLSKADDLDYSSYVGSDGILLTDKEMASLIDNALKSDLFIDSLGINVLNRYELELQVKEISISKNEKFLGDCFNFIMVGKVSLQSVAKDLPWPYNGMLPDSIYVLTESVIKYTDNKVEFLEYGININNMRSKSHEIIVNIINSQTDDDVDEFTLEGFSKQINEIVYNRFEKFADKLHSSISIIETINDSEEKEVLFLLDYKN